MIIRKFVIALRQQDWTTIMIEFLIVVAGIFVGLQVDDWNNQRKLKETAGEYRAQLISDLEVERIAANELVQYHQQVLDYASIALTAWLGTPSADPEALLVALYQASNIVPYTTARGAFDAISNNGLMELLGTPILVTKLSAFYGQDTAELTTGQEKRFRTEIRGVLPVEIQRKIRDTCNQLTIGAGMIETLKKDCSLGIDDGEATAIIKAVVSYPKMLNYLREAISRDEVVIYLLEARINYIDELLSELKG
jgi:hypothetical protein